MANQIKQLYELQQLELDIEQKQGRLKQIQVQLSNREVVAQAEAKREQAKESLSKLGQEHKSIEWQVEDVSTKAKAISDKLYGGTVKNPKELVGLQKDLDTLKSSQKQLEDQLLELMSQIDEANTKLSECEAEVVKQNQLWQDAQGQLKAEQSELELAVAGLEERCKLMRSQIDGAYLSIYDRLRPDNSGKAAAKVEQGMCLGCRISLPMSVVKRVRLGDEIVQCPSCSRILV